MTLISCQPDDPTDDDGTELEAPFETEVGDWEDCGEGTECLEVRVPQVADSPDPVTLHVRRLLPPAEATRVLWYVDGGPGDAGTRLVPVFAFFHAVFDDLAIYAMDQRGTGGSSPLGCPAQQEAAGPGGAALTEEEWPACVASLDPEVLPAFSTEQAAEDLATVIPLVTDGLDTVFLATSYGTFLAQRALERHPDVVSAAILDGLVPADWTFAEFDGSMDATGRTYLGLCDDDPVCAAELGGDAVAFAEATLAGLDAAPCAGLDRAQARALLGALLLTGDFRAAMPAVLARLARCDAADEEALGVLVASILDGADTSQNEVLLANVGSCDLMPPTVDVAGAEAFLDTAVVGTGAGAWMARRAVQWPRWTPPPPSEATTDRPILLLHGGLDPTVPLTRLDELLSAYTHGIAVKPPGAGHVTLNFSDCAVDAYVQFLSDPEGTAPDDCTAEAFEEQFDLDEKTSVLLFGTTDAWGG